MTTLKINSIGSRYWRNAKGKFHRVDGPAVERARGSKEWYKDGKNHRLEGPAVEDADGYRAWWINGKLHREDGPAVEDADGNKYWYLNGKRHREDGPAIEFHDGVRGWYIDGKDFSINTQKQLERYMWCKNRGRIPLLIYSLYLEFF